MSFCISTALSVMTLKTKMAVLVPVSSTNPKCSLPISVHILLLNLKSKTLRMIFVTWFIRLIVRCCSQSTALGFFESVMKMDLLKSSAALRPNATDTLALGNTSAKSSRTYSPEALYPNRSHKPQNPATYQSPLFPLEHIPSPFNKPQAA